MRPEVPDQHRYLARMAFETVSTTDLQAMRDATQDAYLKALNATSYGIGSRNLTRASPGDLLKALELIDRELSARTDTTGGIGFVEIGDEPS